jgi:hypothetical protein
VGGLGPTEIDEQKKRSSKIFFHSPHFFSSSYLHISIIFSLVSFALLASAAKLKRKGNFFLVGGPFWSGGRPPSGGRPGARAPWAPPKSGPGLSKGTPLRSFASSELYEFPFDLEMNGRNQTNKIKIVT